MTKHQDTVPIKVQILTVDHEIIGTVFVSKYTNTNRELTDLLNDKDRRFLAVVDAEIINRKTNTPPRKYNFLEVHIDFIQMVHPTTQVIFKENSRAQEDIARFRDLRDKLNRIKF